LVVERRLHLVPDVPQRRRLDVAVLGPLRAHGVEEGAHATLAAQARTHARNVRTRRRCEAYRVTPCSNRNSASSVLPMALLHGWGQSIPRSSFVWCSLSRAERWSMQRPQIGQRPPWPAISFSTSEGLAPYRRRRAPMESVSFSAFAQTPHFVRPRRAARRRQRVQRRRRTRVW